MESEWREGDIFALYTDGMIEAQSRYEEPFGADRLEKLIVENSILPPAEFKGVVMQELNNYCQDVTHTDDVSLVIVNYHHQRWWLGYAPLEGGRKRLSRAGFTAKGGRLHRQRRPAPPPKAAGSTARGGGFYRVKMG